MDSTLILLALVVVLAVAFDYINGFHDTANAVATVVATNVLPGRTAVLLAALFNFVGAFAGVGVAKTIGGDIASGDSVTQTVVAGALLGAIFWNLLTWYYGIPSSSSHAMIGGLVGSVCCHDVMSGSSFGTSAWALLSSKGVRLTLAALVLSPLFGMIGGFSFMVVLQWLTQRMRPGTGNRSFRALQLFSAGFMAFAHGSNDAQKSMGIITMALISYVAVLPARQAATPGDAVTITRLREAEVDFRKDSGERLSLGLDKDVTFVRRNLLGDEAITREQAEAAVKSSKGNLSNCVVASRRQEDGRQVTAVALPMDVPFWVIFACATAMGLGTASGGWRIMKTMGHKIIKLRPVNGFAAESAGAAVILAASAIGAPVSTTHVISASIMGVGASKRVSAVKWGVAGNILIAWVLTIPISALVSALTYFVMRLCGLDGGL